MTGFEPATTWSQTMCSTKLSHIPECKFRKYKINNSTFLFFIQYVNICNKKRLSLRRLYFLFTFIFGGFDVLLSLQHILSGGLLLGAIFMATDYTTSPINLKGKIVFAIGCGIITSCIRLWANLPEGVSYAILLMNILVPIIEKFTSPKPFGWEGIKK